MTADGDWRALHDACWRGDPGAARRLLAAGADPNRVAPTGWRQRPLHRTLQFRVSHPKHDGHAEVVRLLLAAGADPALRATRLDMTPWELACLCGLQPAERLLRKYRSKSSDGPDRAPELWLAAASRVAEGLALRRVRRYVDHGDIDARWRGATPLIMATAHAAHWRVADLLLDRGADVNAGTSVLHSCCNWHFEHLVPALEFMSSNGWKVDAVDERGHTALHEAAFLGYAAATRKLLELGANPQLRAARAGTPADVARRFKKSAILRLLGGTA